MAQKIWCFYASQCSELLNVTTRHKKTKLLYAGPVQHFLACKGTLGGSSGWPNMWNMPKSASDKANVLPTLQDLTCGLKPTAIQCHAQIKNVIREESKQSRCRRYWISINYYASDNILDATMTLTFDPKFEVFNLVANFITGERLIKFHQQIPMVSS